MKFYSRKDLFTLTFLLLVSAVLIASSVLLFLDKGFSGVAICIHLLIISSLLLLWWTFYNTFYILKDDILVYRHGFYKGSVSIDKIRKIQVGQTLWSGNKPATARNGLIIRYGRQQIYITPRDQKMFVKELIQVNSKIEVVDSSS